MKGILFKPDMIQAIIEGRTTNTRRVEAGLREVNKETDRWNLIRNVVNEKVFIFQRNDGLQRIPKPRYQVGETVYIKEAYCIVCNKSSDAKDACWKIEDTGDSVDCNWANWQSPLFMPEWAARYFILIKDVRAERLQEITEADALAEGITIMQGTHQATRKNLVTGNLELVGNPVPYTALYHYEALWDSINAKPKPVYLKDASGKKYISHYESYPWEEGEWVETYRGKPHYIHGNPFVFRYEFELKEKEKI